MLRVNIRSRRSRRVENELCKGPDPWECMACGTTEYILVVLSSLGGSFTIIIQN
jgi:hypothetical protein